jgi:phospholipase/carboxylesterase
MARLRTRYSVVVLAVLLAALLGGSGAGARESETCAPGLHTLDLGGGRSALMRVNPGDASGKKALLLALHDAGGSARAGLAAFRGGWDRPGLVLVAPSARGMGWSVERRRGGDLRTIDRAMTQAFSRCTVDSRRVGIGGFASGATSALSLGIRNGRLFRAIVALSPGPIAMQTRVGRPRVFVAHGTNDRRSAFDTMLVPSLRREGYTVTLRAFTGGHTVPPAVSRAAVMWFLG